MPASEIEEAWVAYSDAVRTRLLAVPGKITPGARRYFGCHCCRAGRRVELYAAMQEIATSGSEAAESPPSSRRSGKRRNSNGNGIEARP